MNRATFGAFTAYIINYWVNVLYKGKAVIEGVSAEGISLKELAEKKDE